jgi:flagellar motor component MotA
MYNCIPMHTLQTMQDVQRLSPRVLGIAFAAAFVATIVVAAAALGLVALCVAVATNT